MADIRPTKSRSISSLALLLIAWNLYTSEVISRPEPEDTWYNIGPQSNQSINKVVIIANITPPTNGPTQPQQPLTPAGSPLQPSNSVKSTTKLVQPVTPGQKGPETPSSNINMTSTSTSTNSSSPTATSSKSTAAGQSAQSINMTDSKPCKECGSARNLCFPATARLQLHNGFPTAMKNLRVGNKIQTLDISTNQVIFTEVIAFLHKNEETDALYKLLRLEVGILIALSARHLIYAAKTNQSDDVSVVYAEDVIPGDFVRVSGQANTMGQVIRVSTLTSKGVYAPMTRHGTMLVDGILVSCYAHWRSHDIAHKVMAPLRIWYDIKSMLGNILSDEFMPGGIHWYASFLMNFSQSLPSSFAEYVGN